VSAVKTYACLVDLIADVVKETKRKTDIADAVEKAMAEVGEFVPHGTGFTVLLDDAQLSATHVAETDQGVTVEYRNDQVLSYSFPADATVYGAWSP
jgi:hypothetical protein